MHVNYLEGRLSTADIVTHAAKAGYDGIELRGWSSDPKQPLEDYLHHVCRAAQDHELELVLAGNLDAVAPEADRRIESLRQFNVLLRIAADYGVKRLNVFAGHLLAPGASFSEFGRNGSAAANDQHWQTAGKLFGEIADHAADLGIALCLETHACFLHDLPAPALQLLKLIGRNNIKVNLDYPNIHAHPENPGLDKTLDLLGPHIGYVHLKNIKVAGNSGTNKVIGCALDAGHIDVRALVVRILQTGYTGPITLENISDEDKTDMLASDLHHLRSLLKSINPAIA